MNKNNLKDIKVLVVNVHAYGNVGDHLETAPLFYKLKELGVGTIHAHIAKYSQVMGQTHKHQNKIPEVAGKQYLCEPYVDKILYDIPEKPIYDFIIHAPGPSVGGGHCTATQKIAYDIFPQEYLKKCKFIYFGMTYNKSDLGWFEQQISTNARKIVGILSREPFSHEGIKNMLNDITIKKPNIKLPEILMSGDISFSSEISTDMKQANEYYHKFKKIYGENYDLVIVRSSEVKPFKYDHTGPAWFDKNKESKNLQVNYWLKGKGKITHKLGDNLIIATTDHVTDLAMMCVSRYWYPNIPHITCRTVEELHGLVRGASRVYSNRYHGCIMAIHQNKHMEVLYHWEESKMKGAKMLGDGKLDGTYTGDNDEAWKLLNCILRDG